MSDGMCTLVHYFQKKINSKKKLKTEIVQFQNAYIEIQTIRPLKLIDFDERFEWECMLSNSE